MALNIKNEEAHRLARKLARATGDSMAVREAIRERSERFRGNSKKNLVRRILEISADCAPSLRIRTSLSTMATCYMTKKVCRSDSATIRSERRTDRYSTVTDFARFLG
jgi:antitoxin VapB